MNGMKFWMVILLTGLAVCSLGAADEPQGQRTLAVLDFENNSLKDKAEMEPLCKGLSDMFVTELSKVRQFQLVERANLQKILEEMSLGQSGVLEESAAQEVGKMLGAQNLVLGSFMLMFDGKLRIDARLVEVETGKTLMAEEATGSPNDLGKLVTRLVTRNIESMNVELTGEEKKALRQTDNRSFDAALLFARGLDFEEKGDLANARKCYIQALKHNPKFRRARFRLEAIKGAN